MGPIGYKEVRPCGVEPGTGRESRGERPRTKKGAERERRGFTHAHTERIHRAKHATREMAGRA